MKRTRVSFSPLHGLASLGAGGLSVSFFIWLMFLTPHTGTPVPTYESLLLARAIPGQSGWIEFVMTLVALTALAHYTLLFWWLKRGSSLSTQDRVELFSGEAHIFKMIAPLVLAMSVNAGFVVGLVFVPDLWRIKEYLFPIALLAFGALLWIATNRWLKQQRLLKTDQLSYQSKGLIELLATFAFSMITVGFSASAAMSSTVWVYTTGTILAILGAMLSVWAAVRVIADRGPYLREHPIAATATGSLLMGVPILTVLGITSYRLMMAGNHHFGLQLGTGSIATVLGILFVAQLLIFSVAAPKVHQHGGWRTLVIEQPQAASFSLICPGVGLFVLGMFFVSKGLIPMGVLSQTGISIAYGALGVIEATTLAIFVYFLLYAMPGRSKMIKSGSQHNAKPRLHQAK